MKHKIVVAVVAIGVAALVWSLFAGPLSIVMGPTKDQSRMVQP